MSAPENPFEDVDKALEVKTQYRAPENELRGYFQMIISTHKRESYRVELRKAPAYVRFQ